MLIMTEDITNQTIIQNPLEGGLKLNLFQKTQSPVPAGVGKDTTSKYVALRKKHDSWRTMLLGKSSIYVEPKILHKTLNLDKTQSVSCQSAIWVLCFHLETAVAIEHLEIVMV